MIAHIWRNGNTWLLELSEGGLDAYSPSRGFTVIGCANFESKMNAKRAAALCGATPWNY